MRGERSCVSLGTCGTQKSSLLCRIAEKVNHAMLSWEPFGWAKGLGSRRGLQGMLFTPLSAAVPGTLSNLAYRETHTQASATGCQWLLAASSSLEPEV